ncbi:MAG: nucleoside-diphosphate sugar epimerase/dehydratase, partial [Candidatus Limnocylindrales bacterium]
MAVAPDLKSLGASMTSKTADASKRMRSVAQEGAVPVVKRVAERTRSRHLFAIDVVGATLSAMIALGLWLDAIPTAEPILGYLWIVGLIVATRVVVGIGLHLYAHSWRHASVNDMGRIVTCAVAGSVVAYGLVTLIHMLEAPGAHPMHPGPAFWITELGLTFVVMATPRFAIRAASDLQVRRHGLAKGERRRTLLYGAGWAGVIVARSAVRRDDSDIIPVGFLDDDPTLAGSRVAGLPIFGGLEAIPDAVRSTGASSLLITMPSTAGEAIRRVVESAIDQGLTVHTVPPVTDLLDGSLDASRVRKVRVEDLLRRPLAKEHTPAAKDVFTGRTVVVTGAAGSIGSELARQVMALDPGRIALVDQAESPLYLVERELLERVARRQARGLGSATVISSHLVDVTETQATAQLFHALEADIVLHAAAYKHVPMLEDHPSKAVETNIGGTLSVVEAAEAAGVERFVLVSTDKAVWPSSVMGASKRVAEMVVADAARRLGRPYISVRFGNVLGSNGSVVPIFQDQLEKGEALTITDPEMTRYFMTIPEASWLILDAAAIAQNGGLYVLDMGEPVRILDIARDLVRLSGRDPDSVPIKVVGLRKGEKLHEELFYDEETAQPTEVPKVLRAESQLPPASIRADVHSFLDMAALAEPAKLSSALHAYARANLDSEGGLWGMVEGGDVVEHEPGTRPVIILPV